MDLGAFWNGLTQGLNWILTLVVLFIAWSWGRFSAVAGRRAEAAIDELWTRVSRRRRPRHSARELSKKERAETERISQIERERVGRKFTRRTTVDDHGVGEVLNLDPGDPTRRVVVSWSSSPGRRPHEDDYAEGVPISIEWRHLVMAPGGAGTPHCAADREVG